MKGRIRAWIGDAIGAVLLIFVFLPELLWLGYLFN